MDYLGISGYLKDAVINLSALVKELNNCLNMFQSAELGYDFKILGSLALLKSFKREIKDTRKEKFIIGFRRQKMWFPRVPHAVLHSFSCYASYSEI